jgi:hypothetical protein
MEDSYKTLLDQYPFLSYIVYGGNDYIGIIQNSDELITTIYDFGNITNNQHKQKFLELANVWRQKEWRDCLFGSQESGMHVLHEFFASTAVYERAL